MKNKFNLILASQSPRRRELLAHTGLNFSAISLDVEEFSDSKDPKQVALDISAQKVTGAKTHAEGSDIEHAFYVVSDTLVAVDGEVLGKPDDLAQAQAMLEKLADKQHAVFTSVGFLWKELDEWNEHYFVDEAKVTFGKIDSEAMRVYLATGESMDKAGSYGIQGPALAFIDRLEGSYSTVMGFPLSRFMHELEQLFETKVAAGTHWRELFK